MEGCTFISSVTYLFTGYAREGDVDPAGVARLGHALRNM